MKLTTLFVYKDGQLAYAFPMLRGFRNLTSARRSWQERGFDTSLLNPREHEMLYRTRERFGY